MGTQCNTNYLTFTEEKKMVNKFKELSRYEKAEIIVGGVSMILLTWIVASYIDIVSHNLNTHIYQWWNCFRLF